MVFEKHRYLRKAAAAAVGVCTLIFTCTSGTFAYWQISGRTTNLLTMNSFRTEILEEYTQPDSVFPGSAIDKVVHVSNTGSVDCYVRVQLCKVFGTRDADGKLRKEDSLDPDMIEISCNDRYWKEIDGYWYYTEVLEAGTRTKEPLMEEFYISEKAGNEYRGKDAQIVVLMESIQAEGDALQTWEVTRSDLGIVYAPEVEGTKSVAEYCGGEQGFQFSGFGTDLFTCFKNLVPGASRTQYITVRNTSDLPVSLTLHAEASEQDPMSPAELALVEELLAEYAQITIESDGETLYTGPVNGNLHQSTEQNMGASSPIVLGHLLPEDERELTVHLSLSADMDNEFQELTGKVDWIFTAQGEDAAEEGMVPKTGDETNLLLPASLLAGSVLLMIALLMRQRSRIHEKC